MIVFPLPLPLLPLSMASRSGGEPLVTLSRYRPDLMKPDATILFVGPRRTGKSTLVLDILYHLRQKIFAAIAQTPTEETAEELGKVLPWSCVHNDFDPARLGSAVNAMKQLVGTERRLAHKQGREPERRILLVLLDDCMADTKNMKHKIIQDIFYNGRHYDLLFINVQQYVMDMPSKLRTNIDIIVSTYDSAPDSQERLWKYFFKSAFPSYERFRKVYHAATSNFKAIILDRTIQGVPEHKKIFWYKAQHPAPVYRLGHKSQWIMHCKYLRSRAEELKGDIAFISETVRRLADGNDDGGGGAGSGAGGDAEMGDELVVRNA